VRMDTEKLSRIAFVPRTQLPKTGYSLKEDGTQFVVARACPFSEVMASKWGQKQIRENTAFDVGHGYFDYIATLHKNAELNFSQGLFAVSVLQQNDVLSFFETDTFVLEYICPKTKDVEEHSVKIDMMNMHRNNSVAWVWLE